MSKKVISFKLLMLIMFFSGLGVVTSFAQQYKNGVLQGTIRIKLQPSLGEAVSIKKTADNKTIHTGITAIDNLNTKYSVSEMKRVFRYSPKFEERHRKHGLHLWYEIKVSETVSLNNIIEKYGNLQEVTIAEPILEKKLIQPGNAVKVDLLNLKSTKSMPYNDPYLPQQWHYDNTGQTGGIPGEDIRLFNAWTISTGAGKVIVSIHDEGIQTDHEDLAGAMYVNEAELNGEPNVDDDGNGYKDDIYGFNFSANTGASVPHYHATHVAGTVGAINNNGIGVSGIAGGSGNGDGVRILPCQILGGTGSGNTADSYVYAADMGAVISQNSWGYTSPGTYSQSVLDAIDYFIAEAGNYLGSPMKGGVVIFASGNSNVETEMYPGYYEPVISVAALDASANKTAYSNYGTWLDIAAPGGDSEDDFVVGNIGNYSNGVFSTFDNNSYGYLDGTSMACPHVSGIAALIVSAYGDENFTNEDLKTHLLTGTRGSIYETVENQNYLGKLGVGYADAELALAKDNKISPEAISDLILSDIAQDFAILQWTVPTDSDDGRPYEFEIIYSTEMISLATMDYAKTMRVSNKSNPGDPISFEVGGLMAVTDYNFSVRSLDRWGNISDFSNIVSAKTNAGPDAEIDSNNLSVDIVIDITIDTLGVDSFKLFNYGEGLLRWDAITRHITSEPLSTKPVLNYPILDILSLSSPKGFRAVTYNNVPNPEPFNIENDNNDELSHIDNYYNFWVIGETDTAYTNSAATRFYVDNINGFNLTNVDAVINHDETTGPIILEIYVGENISDAKLFLAQEINESASLANGIQWTHIELSEQIFLEQGTYFWIVYHIPAGNLYPLGASLENEKEASKNCYISTNLGKTWDMFEDVYYDNQIVWAVVAMSNYLNIDEYIVLSPDSGDVVSADSVSISALVNGANMVNGLYQGNIVINTNETDEPMLRIPVNVTIQGHLPKLTSVKRTDFGSIIYGNSKIVELSLKNEGLGKFYSPKVSSISDAQFEYLGGLKTMQAGDELMLAFKYTPSASGIAYAKVTITDTEGIAYSFELVGVAADPPIARLNRPEDTYTNLAIGDTINGAFYLVNDGAYPLDYYLPNFADGSNMAEIPENVHKYGYITNLDKQGVDPAFVWNDISETGVNIVDGFSGNRYTNIYQEVDLGFEFNFFGKNEKSVFVTKYGVLSFDEDGLLGHRWPYEFKDTVYMPDRFISAMGMIMQFSEAGFGDVYYQRYIDKFVVQYDNVPWEEGYEGRNLTFQIILHDNGNINIYYKDVNVPDIVFDWGGTVEFIDNFSFIAIEDQTINDGILVHSQKYKNFKIESGTTIEYISPGHGIYTNGSPSSGTLSQGDSVLIEYSLETKELYVESYTENLVVITNDPFNNPAIYSAHLEITSGGVAEIHASDSIMDFVQVFQNDTEEMILNFTNTGKAKDSIMTAVFDNNNYHITGNVPEELKPGRTLFYTIGIKTPVLGVFNDTLRITTKEGKVFKIALLGEIIGGPEMSINPTSITSFATSGTKKTSIITVSNPGDYDLDLAFVGNDWITFKEKVTTKSVTVPEYTYRWKRSDEEGGPTYDWIEIAEGDGIKIDSIFPYQVPNFTKGIKLPFTFNYYGNEYDSIYIGYSGLVSFTAAQDIENFYAWGAPTIPSTAIPNNYIAPLWLGGGADWDELFPYTGQYYKIEADRIIIEYRDYINGFSMGYPISYQVILYENGNIKFQYKMPTADGGYQATTSLGTIGIENIDGSEGIMISHNEKFVDSDIAILIYPLEKHVVPMGTSKQFISTLDATNLMAGIYQYDVEILNNAPLSQGLTLPITLVVSGTPEIQIPDSLYFGDLMIDGSSVVQEVQIKNIGTDKFTLERIDQFLPEDVKIDFKYGSLWYPISTFFSTTEIAARSSLDLRITMLPKVPINLNDTIILTISELGVFKIPIIAAAFNPPVIGANTEIIEVYAETADHSETKTFIIDNVAGGYDLNYDLSIEFDRSKVADTKSAITKGDGVKSTVFELFENKFIKPKSAKSTKNTKADYNRILAHDTVTEPESNLGYGGGTSFHTATAFNAPIDGFNLTHVQTWYTAGNWLNGKITVNVYGGNININNAELIHSQDYTYSLTEENQTGELITIELEKNILFYPNETFFIEFVYDVGAEYPQGVVMGLEEIENRFLYGNGQGWNDLVGSGYDDYGWMVRAVEETFASAAWVSLSSANAGVVSPGENVTISLDFSATYANSGNNYADLHIVSNDPVEADKIVKLILKRNQGPIFDFEDLGFTVNENDTLSFRILATDLEGDNFTLALNESYNFVNSSFLNGELQILCTPDYESDGQYVLTVLAKDEHGNTNETSVQIEVLNSNRKPLAEDVGVLSLVADGDYYYLSDNELFTEPDDDEITITAISDNDSTTTVFTSGTDFILKPVNIGETDITFTATDIYGGTAINIVHVKVSENAGGGSDDELDTEAFMCNTVFSPNGDGINDTWTIENAELYSKAIIIILNERGQEVFKSIGYEIPWDGTNNGETLNIGTYYYIITFSNGTKKSGSIALIK